MLHAQRTRYIHPNAYEPRDVYEHPALVSDNDVREDNLQLIGAYLTEDSEDEFFEESLVEVA